MSRTYRPNLYFAGGPPIAPRFRHMGPVVKSIVTTVRVRYAVETLGRFEELYPRSGHNSRGEIIQRANQLLWEWSQHEPLRPPDRHVLSDLLTEVNEELEAAITHLTPLWTFYGEHPRNSQWVGVWPDEDQIEESIASGELVQVQTILKLNQDRLLGEMLESTLAASQQPVPEADGWSGHVILVHPGEWFRVYWIQEGKIGSLIWHYTIQ